MLSVAAAKSTVGRRMAKGKNQPELFAETEQIASLLSKESTQDVVILLIPSHDRHNKPLPEPLAAEWASNAMRLFADLYRGATAFRAAHGIFKTDEGHYLHDAPLVIEAFAEVDAIQDVSRLNSLVDFCKRMGKALDQESIMLAFGNIHYYIEDYRRV